MLLSISVEFLTLSLKQLIVHNYLILSTVLILITVFDTLLKSYPSSVKCHM